MNRVDDVTAEGFTLGKITDFEAEPCDQGNAFVIAPDGSRAGLGGLRSSVLPRSQAHRDRQVGIGFLPPMNSRETARRVRKTVAFIGQRFCNIPVTIAFFDTGRYAGYQERTASDLAQSLNLENL